MSCRALVVLLTISLVGCSAGAPADSASADDVDADAVVEMHEMTYEPDGIEVPAGETVTIHLVNAGSLRHDLVLPDGTESEVLNAEESAVVEIGPLSEDVTAWCSVPGHREAGMELQILVSE